MSEDYAYDYRRLERNKECASQLFHLIEEAYAGVAHWSETSFSDDVANENSYYFGAFYKGELIACVGLQVVLGEGTITNVAVAPLHRRQHVARSLWQFAKEQLAVLAIPIDVYFLEVRASNRAAQSFYESEGFTCYFTRQAYYDNPNEDAKLYRLDV